MQKSILAAGHLTSVLVLVLVLALAGLSGAQVASASFSGSFSPAIS